MASSSSLPRREPDGHGTEVRLRIAAAARDLFASQGYDRTTVEAIAERAGVARRTFFRHFRSKDDAIFPDHAQIAASAQAHLEALGDVPPLIAVASGVRLVFLSYVDDPVVSVERYRLSRLSPPLRDREIASVSRYTRLFGNYLRGRYGDTPGGALKAETVSAAFVAAHNHVLRGWLRSSGQGDPMPALEEAFAWVASRFAEDDDGPSPAGHPAPPAGTAHVGGPALPGDGEEVVVAVFRSGEPIDDVMERISRSL